MNALAELDQVINFGLEELTNLRISGSVTEVTPSYYRLTGLSHFIKLGECVGINHNGVTQLAEVVRIDAEAATVKTFEAQVAAGLGDQAYRVGPLHVAPDVSWKGRVIDALGRPIDTEGPLPRRACRADRSGPPGGFATRAGQNASEDRRSHDRSLHADLRWAKNTPCRRIGHR